MNTLYSRTPTNFATKVLEQRGARSTSGNRGGGLSGKTVAGGRNNEIQTGMMIMTNP
jgi:hypothetical protein